MLYIEKRETVRPSCEVGTLNSQLSVSRGRGENRDYPSICYFRFRLKSEITLMGLLPTPGGKERQRNPPPVELFWKK